MSHFPKAKVKLRLSRRVNSSYPIVIQKGLIKKLPAYLKEEKFGQRYAIITDTVVKKLFGDALMKRLKRAGIKAEIFTFKKGVSIFFSIVVIACIFLMKIIRIYLI